MEMFYAIGALACLLMTSGIIWSSLFIWDELSRAGPGSARGIGPQVLNIVAQSIAIIAVLLLISKIQSLTS
jgi:hypothetical protein